MTPVGFATPTAFTVTVIFGVLLFFSGDFTIAADVVETAFVITMFLAAAELAATEPVPLYFTTRALVPGFSLPAGTVMVTLPAPLTARALDASVTLPRSTETVPVGFGVPATVTVALTLNAAPYLAVDGTREAVEELV